MMQRVASHRELMSSTSSSPEDVSLEAIELRGSVKEGYPLRGVAPAPSTSVHPLHQHSISAKLAEQCYSKLSAVDIKHLCNGAKAQAYLCG